jgi:predicted 3-demethylubiquinone-9 3-methyltransferase (glyoxalase superfamily)
MTTIAPCLWFDGKAEEAARFYVSLLPDSRIDSVVPYYFEAPGGKPGDVMMVEFTLAGQSYLALNGGPAFQFTPAVSLCVSCEDQAEIDRLWDALCDGGAPGRCGWLTDRYGVSWQIVPKMATEMMKGKNAEKIRRTFATLMTMNKFDLEALRKAFDGAPAA